MTQPRFAVDYSRLPPHMVEAARLYIEEGIPPGGFFASVLVNAPFTEVASHADSINIQALREWAEWLWQIPRIAWGSPTNVHEWISHRGMAGLASKES